MTTTHPDLLDRLAGLIVPYGVDLDALHPAYWSIDGDRYHGDMWHQQFEVADDAPPVDVWITDDDTVIVSVLAPQEDRWFTEYLLPGVWQWVDGYRCQDCLSGRHLPGSSDCPMEAI